MTERGPSRPAVLLLATIAIGAAVAACQRPQSDPVSAPVPSGPMDVLGPVPAFEPSPLPGDWITEGPVGRGQMAVVERAGVPAIRVINGPASFIAAKPTRASLLATPYLSWAWNLEAQDGGIHPVRLVVGFDGGRRPGGAGAHRLVWPGERLPSHDRAVVIAWGESALQRGTITTPKPAKDGEAAARYTARGGRENAGSWWLETVDLSDIYRRSWPADDASSVRITFIGFGAAGGKPVSPAHLAGIRLSR